MLLTDFRHALRGLVRRPGFTIVAVLTLSLGVGATTAIFSALYHTLLRPMPYHGGDRLMYVWMRGGEVMISPNRQMLDAWRGRLRSFDLVSEYEGGEYALYGGTVPEVISGTAVQRDLPAKLGVQPILGRTFTEEEMQTGGRRAVVLSEGLWKRRFGGRNDVLGEKLELGEESYEIVGVLPNRFGAFTGSQRESQVWLPLMPLSDTAGFGSHNLLVRLREGVDTLQANAELRTLAANAKAGTSMSGMEWVPQVVDPRYFVNGTAQKGLPILFAAVGAVLLIGCANIAGLLLVRLAGRRREVAIRAAIGASRRSVLSLLSAESLLLALMGGVLGVLASVWLLELIRLVRPASLNSIDAAGVSGTTLLFALGVTLVTALLFGSVPAFSATRRNLLQPLLSGGGAGARVTGSNRARSLLVIGQIGLSLTLLVAAMLLVRTVGELQARDVGFNPEGVLVLKLDLPESRYPDADSRRALIESVLPSLRRLPTVTSAAYGSGIPTEYGMMFGAPSFADRPLKEEEKPAMMSFAAVTPDYAAAMGIRLVEGTFPDARDGGVVINEGWARKLWPGESAVGRQLKLGANATEWNRITGVARDITTTPAATIEHPHVYVAASYDWGDGWVVLRTTRADPLALVPQVRAIVNSLDTRLVPRDFTTMNAALADGIAMQRFFMLLLAAFAGLALLLSVVGLYGVISSAVAQRTAEIGIRLALGATPAMVRRLVLTQSARLLGAGMLLGLAGAALAMKLIRSSLYGVEPWDPASFALSIMVLAAAALAATYIPARRALRVDPLTTLRAD